MEWNYNNLLILFSRDSNKKVLLDGLWGLEKESLRVTHDGNLALTTHPDAFGDKTTNNTITTDFSESQLELITSPFQSIELAYDSLINIHKYATQNINNELLWPLSMPGRLPDEALIPIAKFNNTDEGREKEIYRRGLSVRYGKKMQMISGIHYNFSFQDNFWKFLYNKFHQHENNYSFKNQIYFAIARNFLRYRWLLLYLFGSSPVIDKSFEETILKKLGIKNECGCLDKHSFFTQYVTSLRLSIFGYSNSFDKKVNISFDNLELYIRDLRYALSSKSEKSSKLGLFAENMQIQLNYNILQKENEYYSPIRFKQSPHKGESLVDALQKKGVEYLELRIFDLNPFNKIGIDIETLYFTHLFILFCLFEKNKLITDEENKYIDLNHHLTALTGRKKDLRLFKNRDKTIRLTDWAREIIDKIRKIAILLDKDTNDKKFENSAIAQLRKLDNQELLPSTKILSEMDKHNENFTEFGSRIAKEYLTRRKDKHGIQYSRV